MSKPDFADFSRRFEQSGSISIHEIFSKGGDVKLSFANKKYFSKSYNFKAKFNDSYTESTK